MKNTVTVDRKMSLQNAQRIVGKITTYKGRRTKAFGLLESGKISALTFADLSFWIESNKF